MIINPYIFNIALSSAVNGYLYNWYAASNANFAPTDWKVPTNAECDILNDYLTANGFSGIEGSALKSTSLWNANNGTDDFGFTAKPSGVRYEGDGTFGLLYYNTYFWNINEYDIYTAPCYGLSSSNNLFQESFGNLKTNGFSIRLLYDGSDTPDTVTDYDGRVYDTVVIGTQRWTVQNWACTKLNNGDDIPNVTDNTAWAALTTLGRCAYDNNEGYV